MKHSIIGLTFLIFVTLLSFDVSAVGLQEYLQDANAEQVTSATLDAPESLSATMAKGGNKLTDIIELVVAGIVGSALIISVLVLFLGRWAGRNEKRAIKKLRVEAEKEKDHITSAVATVREKEKETNKLVHDMKNQSSEFGAQKMLVQKHTKDVLDSTVVIKSKERELIKVSDEVSERMDDIQAYWETQLHDTVSTIKQLQTGLDKNVDKVDNSLEMMSRQKELSQELLQDFLARHHTQGEMIEQSTDITSKVSETLEQTLEESVQLVTLLKQHKESAEKSLKQFNEELIHYEEQAYEQFDTSFQVADLARQELTANIDESRKHIETMRRHEEQSHTLNAQTQKNLEALDYSKIVKLSNTLDSTQDMFTDIRSRVDDAKSLLDELKDIETDIRNKASDVEEAQIQENDALEEVHAELQKEKGSDVENVYKLASGDNTPVSFFSKINQLD